MSPIDTLKASKRLQEEGVFSPEQAERIAEILSSLDVGAPRRTTWMNWEFESVNGLTRSMSGSNKSSGVLSGSTIVSSRSISALNR